MIECKSYLDQSLAWKHRLPLVALIVLVYFLTIEQLRNIVLLNFTVEDKEHVVIKHVGDCEPSGHSTRFF